MNKKTREDCADLLYQCTAANGAMACSSSGDKCLDLFFIAGAIWDPDPDRVNVKVLLSERCAPIHARGVC